MEKTINKFILSYCSHWKCDTVRPWNYNYKITSYNNQRSLIKSCLKSKNKLDDEKTALNFYESLKLKITKSPQNKGQDKLLLRDLKLLIEKRGFPLSPEQKGIFLRKFIENQLNPEQKKLLKNVINIGEIRFVDSSDNSAIVQGNPKDQ